MSKKKGSMVALIIFTVLSISVFYTGVKMDRESLSMASIGPGYFPKLASAILFIFCIVSIVNTLKKEDVKIEIGNISMYIFTLIASSIFIILWKITNAFYVLTFILMLIMIHIFGSKAGRKGKKSRLLIIDTIISFGVIVFTYFAFEKLLGFIF